jgi:hypothetical protein
MKPLTAFVYSIDHHSPSSSQEPLKELMWPHYHLQLVWILPSMVSMYLSKHLYLFHYLQESMHLFEWPCSCSFIRMLFQTHEASAQPGLSLLRIGTHGLPWFDTMIQPNLVRRALLIPANPRNPKPYTPLWLAQWVPNFKCKIVVFWFIYSPPLQYLCLKYSSSPWRFSYF